jgi:APA family basic amino acid/polyamine antiporter
MPIGILASLGVCTLLYVLVALVLTGLVRYDLLSVADPIARGVDAAGPGLLWLRPLVKIGAIAGLSSVVLVTLFGQSRVLYAMARDGLLPARLAELHHAHGTPYFATILTGSFGAAMAAVFPIGVLGEMVSIGTLLAFTIVCVGVLVLRRADPALPRPFRAPGGPFVPLLGAMIALLQILFLPPATWLRLAVWMGVGLAVYFSFGRSHSLLGIRTAAAAKEAGLLDPAAPEPSPKPPAGP